LDVANDTSSAEKAALDLYCLGIDGSTFKCTVLHQPYFYVLPTKELYDDQHNNSSGAKWNNLISHVMRRFEPLGLQSVEVVNLQDLDMMNHLSPSCNGRQMLKLIFDTVQQLNEVKRDVMSLVQQNQQRTENATHSIHFFQDGGTGNDSDRDPLAALEDIREYDVPYTLRICIDLNIRAGTWYTITPTADHSCSFSDANATKRAEPGVLAFDIECSKAPLKFPDANAGDEIFMISYMVNGKGYLVTSRTVVSKDISDFEYTPKPHFPGPFEIFNERNEEALIRRFFSHYREIKPQIVVTYNGDFFDWPFLEARAKVHGLDMEKNLGIAMQPSGEYRGRTAVHLDAFHWVRRDSYLPQGSQGLKAVTKYKLGYDPVEVDPEDMIPYAIEQPVKMATYSVSDAVATFYLYQTYVHFFIFSLCTIIPMNPEDVLRKGSGTLCEALLMVEAFEKGIICPNKQVDPAERFHNGHLVESETYIGGKVECLETGVYRSDIEYDFDMVPSAFDGLIAKVDRDLKFSIEVEGGKKVQDIENYDDIKKEIIERLEELRDRPKRKEQPFVYHLDVGAMYPNIILTNRLQPNAIVDDATCAACDFNQESNNCKRKMKWVWRGDYNPASRAEYEQTKNQLVQEIVDGSSFGELPANEQAKLVSSRLKQYSKNAYNKTKVTEEETRLSTTCMRENDFYVATVLRFRDRRYELKKLTKSSKKAAESASNAVEKKEAEDKVLIYDSLQVAHKCILNSFYGYVMRKGARWRSMEMAGVVTKTGADLITQARILVEQIGRPLELDTDGIWVSYGMN
jgi:DNA polymerase epsilon subunit 1